MKALLRRLSGAILQDYRINWINAASRATPPAAGVAADIRPVEPALHAMIAASPSAKVANSLSYARAGMAGLALLRDGRPLCIAHFAQPAQYSRAKTWPLRAQEIALMDIAPEDAARGQGLAPRLIAASARHFLDGETRRLIAFIWWSNTPSVRAFTKAGWRRVGLSVELCIAGRWVALHLPLAW